MIRFFLILFLVGTGIYLFTATNGPVVSRLRDAVKLMWFSSLYGLKIFLIVIIALAVVEIFIWVAAFFAVYLGYSPISGVLIAMIILASVLFTIAIIKSIIATSPRLN